MNEENMLSLKFEKLYQSLMVDTKKRYSGWLKWKKGKEKDDIQIVGIQARRSDSSLQVHYLQPAVLGMILRGSSVADVEELIFKEIDKIKNPTDYEYLAIPVRLGKSKYQNDIPKQRAVNYAKQFLGLNFLVGMKPLLIYIDNKDSDCICFEVNSQLENKEIKLNVKKMVERNIFLPLESILTIWRGEEYWEKLKLRILNLLNGQKELF
jgi:DNA polymerase I